MSTLNFSQPHPTIWKDAQKIAFRFVLLFFLVLVVPLDWKFYREIFSVNWFSANFYDLFVLTKYSPRFFSLQGFGNWLVMALIAALGTAAWTIRGDRNINYDWLHYAVRVVVRYRLALGVIAYGLIKIFPMQMPYPSLSNLHTKYGEFLPWKIYFHTIAIAPAYEVFLGLIEIGAGILLLFRRTTTIGSGIILAFSGIIFAANLAYSGGEEVYGASLLIMALFLFAYDAPRVYSLIIEKRFTVANRFQPVFTQRLKFARCFLKGAAAVFILLLALTTYSNFNTAPFKYPATPGLSNAYGFYNVSEFKLNNRTIPYSAIDSSRWQNVVFEKWATLSIKTAAPVIVDQSRGDSYHANDIDRDFESAGVGERRYYAYQQDTANALLHLRNKNKNYPDETYTLSFRRPNDSTIVVNGVNDRNDSVHAVLNKVDQRYLFYEGRRKRVKI